MLRRIREGGSWHVQVSLCCHRDVAAVAGHRPRTCRRPGTPVRDSTPISESCETEAGRLDYLGPVVQDVEDTARLALSAADPGADQPRWAESREEMHAAEEQSA